jgi:hypothetical protein
MEKILLYELHLTVEALYRDDLQPFESLCGTLGGKALVIELQEGVHSTQPMFSTTYHAHSTEDAIQQAEELGVAFKAKNYSPIRYKLEVDAVYGKHKEHNNGYYEWHGKVVIEKAEDLLRLCKRHGAHLSLNALKNSEDSRFVTLREYGTFETFHKRLDELKNTLSSSGFAVLKQHHEYCVYDSKIALDDGWL